MRTPVILLRFSFLVAAVTLFIFCLLANAQSRPGSGEPGDPKLQDWKPAVIPSAAIAYGEALEAAAPPKLREWCEKFARKEMPKRKIDPKETMTVVDQQFPKNSDAARDAAIYLLTYVAYKEEDRTQRQAAAFVSRLDDEAHDIVLRQEQIAEAENRRKTSTRTTVSQQELIRNEESARNAEQRLREMNTSRRDKMRELEKSRRRVEAYLKVMSVTHPRMEGIEPSVLREFQ
jgi:hypothetical protein